MIKTVIKKNTSEVPYDFGKVVTAVTKSAERCGVPVSEIDFEQLQQLVESKIDHQKVHVSTIHTAVENSLGELHHKVAMSYKDYRNYRKDTTETWDHIYKQARETLYLGDRENANFD